MRRVNNPTLIEDHDLQMECSLIALNDESPVRRETIRRLVKAWEDSGRNVRKMLDSSKELSAELKPYFYDEHGRPAWWAAPTPRGSGLQVMLMAVGPNTAMTRDELLRDEPRLVFMELLVNPLRDNLSAGPCGRCGKYYLKSRTNQKSYCGRRCGSIASAKKSTRERLDKEHRHKLEQAQAAIQEWNALKRHPVTGWKQWASKRVPGITPKFITRAVNKGELIPPNEREMSYATRKD